LSKYLEVTVRSNTEALSERALHESLVSTVNETLRGAETFLRADRLAHSRTGLTVAHIKRESAEDLVAIIEGKLGVTSVHEKDGRPTHGLQHSQAPIFVDQGTRTPIFSTQGKTMWNRPEGIFNRRSVRGQPGQHFMAKSYAEAQAILHSDKSVEIALGKMAAEAAALLPIIEA
jgi:hypothetical protein